MTIREMITMLEKAAQESEKGENATVMIYADEEGTWNSSEVFVGTRDNVIIQ